MKGREFGIALVWAVVLTALVAIGLRLDPSFHFPAAGLLIVGAVFTSLCTGALTTAFAFLFFLGLLFAMSSSLFVPERAWDWACLCFFGSCLLSRVTDRHTLSFFDS